MSVIKPLPVTDDNRTAVAYVGTTPAEGLVQLEILKRLGCWPQHDVLEIGCGALIAGYPIMQYLAPGGYCGIEPNTHLFFASLDVLRGDGALARSEARFAAAPNFRSGDGAEAFDFILSHSIASHTSDAQLTDMLAAIAEQLRPGGAAAISLRLAEGNAYGSPGSKVHGAAFATWQYPGVSWFRRDDVFARAAAAGLTARLEPEFTRMILAGNPKSCHDWIVLTKAGA
ncbi:MAG TPA: class I SAM-dependent methyltransferase [Casimicrobiaceae bacterium]|nr:class I SAM-dependent methyltransferase [Casimicrobiaceae bacterium]